MGASTRYVVFGAGAVGGTAAVLLRQAGHAVCAVARGPQRAAIADKGLLLRTPDGERRVELDVVSPSRLQIDRERDLILLTVKSQDTALALDQIVAAGGDGARIVCAQNGVANEPAAARVTDRVGSAMVWTPAQYLSPGEIESYASPRPALWVLGDWPGGASREIEALAAVLDAAGLSAVAHEDVMSFKYTKLLDNLANAVDALFDVGSGEIDERWRALAKELRAEGQACLAAAGVQCAARDEFRRLRELVVMQPIGENERAGGSTWQSLARNAGRHELEFLNGEICSLGLRHAVPTPKNRAMLRIAAELMRNNAPPRSARFEDI